MDPNELDGVVAEAPSSGPATDDAMSDPSDGLSRMDELIAQIRELERRMPPPDRADILADAGWFEAHAREMYQQHPNMCVAILNGRVAGVGPDELQLRLDLARQYDVHPSRPVVVETPTWDRLHGWG